MSAPDGMDIVKDMSQWLRDLNEHQERPSCPGDRGDLLSLLERKVDLFARMAQVHPEMAIYAEVTIRAQAQVDELRAELAAAPAADGYPPGWPRCSGGCGGPALDGKATCGELACRVAAATASEAAT